MKSKVGEPRPCARREGLVVQELSDEVLVYDLDRHKAHCLNQAAAMIWKQCDGQKSVKEIVRRAGKKLGTPIDEQVVWLALSQLEKKHLLRERVSKPAEVASMSRRALVQRVGLTAVLLPLITSITAPTALANVSCSGSCNPTINNCPAGCFCSPSTSTCVRA